ncbi:MAG: hypothetical protein D6729_13270 [Deltaproteobacteria bacterium]|nr:MAG: hypothetical protein D6729_13270 [Deltaproteobacteria bacterium]
MRLALSSAAVLLVWITLFASPLQAAEPTPYDPRYPIEAPPIAPYWGHRIMGMGGAFVGVAEGAEGIPTSLCSLANRRPNQAGFFDYDLGLSWVIPANSIDLDFREAPTPKDMRFVAFGGLVRLGRFGFGLFFDSADYAPESNAGGQASVLRGSMGLGWALPDDDFVLGMGYSLLGYTFAGPGGARVPYSFANAFSVDLLYRPKHRPYRMGVSLKLPAVARIDRSPGSGLPPAIVRPAEFALGASWWLGDGEINTALPTTDEHLPLEPATTGLLVALDLFFVGPSRYEGMPAAGLAGYYEGRLELAGRRTTMGIRLGGETEAVPGAVRMRGGLWLEPSRYHGGVRPHLTGGFDVRLVRIYWWTFRISFSFDFAQDYAISSLGLGLW